MQAPPLKYHIYTTMMIYRTPKQYAMVYEGKDKIVCQFFLLKSLIDKKDLYYPGISSMWIRHHDMD